MNHIPEDPSGTEPGGHFDPNKADQLRSQAIGAYRGKKRKLLRTAGTYLVLLIFLSWVCLRLFNRSTDVQSWVFYAVLFLALYESTVLIKLWYWVVNTKLDILREIKTLRMDIAVQRGSQDLLQEADRIGSDARPRDVSKTETYVWQAILVALGLLLAYEIGRHSPLAGGWLSFRNLVLEQTEEITPGQTNIIPFTVTGSSLILGLRADTQQGTVSFEVYGPDGQLLGRQTGGGLTVDRWVLNAPGRGTYNLRVISNEATGSWRVRLEQTDRGLTSQIGR
jgi:hypothetical protein